EIKAFFGHPDIPIEVAPEAVPYYFIHGYVPGPATLYKHVRHLEPGTVMTVEADGRTSSRRYWRIERPKQTDIPPIGRGEAVGGGRDPATPAGERRLGSAVPLGACPGGRGDATVVLGAIRRRV